MVRQPNFTNVQSGVARDAALKAARDATRVERVETIVAGVVDPSGNVASGLSTSDIVAVSQGGKIKSATIADIGALIGGGGGATTSGASIDFGSGGYSASVTIADASVTALSNIGIVVRREDDEGEWDALSFQTFCSAGSFVVRCTATPGPVYGVREFRYIVYPS